MILHMDDQSLEAVVKGINRKRYKDIVVALDDPTSEYNEMMDELRYHSIAQEAWKSTGKRGARLFAALTPEQDHALSKAYGPNYYRDKKLLRKLVPQAIALNRDEI